MRKFSLIILGFIFVFVSCNKNEEEEPVTDTLVPQKSQWGFALNYTATWCGPCGSWGAPLIHELEEMGNVVAITAHASGDPMFNQGLYNSFENVRTNGGGIPSFWIGDTKTNNESFMTTLLEQEPVAGIAISSSKSGTSITVKTKTEFFEAGEGEYYLSVLILESGIDGSSSSGQYAQNGTDTPATYKHDFVLRASATDGNAYGELVTTDPAKGTTVSKNYTITLEESWNNEVYAVAVLWRKSTTGMPVFEFVNAVK